MITPLLLALSLVTVRKDPHTVRMVTVEPGVKIEVVDWGGKGPALVFLAGLGNTAHVFDNFAPRFANKYHVYGITRRGFGESTLAKAGYDTPRLVADIVTVLDSLRVKKAVIAGHSISGDELSLIGATHPERIRGLIYLDAAYDHSTIDAMIRKYPGASPYFTEERTRNAPLDSLMNMLDYAAGVRLPINEMYQTINIDRNGITHGDRPNAAGLVIQQVKPVDYRNIKVPSLAIFGLQGVEDRKTRRYKDLSAADRVLQDSQNVALYNYQRTNMDRYRSEAGNGRVVKLFGVGHYIFLHEPKRVESEMRAFIATLKN